MKYWEDFQTKFGFGDGDEIPRDAWHVRYVYVRELNKLLKANGSSVRVCAYDRGGCHNPMLILPIPATVADSVSETVLCSGDFGFCGEPAKTDSAFSDAVAALGETDVDDLVTIGRVRTSKRRARRV